ncbi:hypothetical protein ACGFNU_00635 [Spirillospora sp. NPDC048911]|uniref:hypothetical protein n=1 Tax=Spirillospora sp. NPDC048911 TaxID=3364527 RepID=UPI0037222203
MRMLQPYDQATWTLEQIVAYAKTAAYAGIENVAKNGESWLFNNLYQVARNGVALPDVVPGTPYAYVVPAGQRDPFAVLEMMRLFEFGRVEIEQARRRSRRAARGTRRDRTCCGHASRWAGGSTSSSRSTSIRRRRRASAPSAR